MVSTRRTAHNEPEQDMTEPDLSKTLRKKPVRRATAKKTEPEPQQKARATRGRKAAPTPEETQQDESVSQEPEITQPEKPARRVGRPKKQAPTPAVEEPTPIPQPTKPTRSTAASRAKNTEAAEKRREVPTTDEPKPTRRTRATAPEAQPLSPKKITQISKPRSKTAKIANQKQATIRPTARARVTKRRTVSDENADIPDLVPNDEQDDEVVVLSSTQVKRVSPLKEPASENSAESDASMSSAPTTPSHSPAPSFDRMNDEHEYRQRGDAASPSHASDEEEANEDTVNDSDDELCGPKTPMKRSSLGAEARYLASVQRTVRRMEFNTPLESPRAFANRLNKGGTPQTQKPYNKPVASVSAIRLSTVARDSDRASMSEDLDDTVTMDADEHHSSFVGADPSPVEEDDESTDADQDEALHELDSPTSFNGQYDDDARREEAVEILDGYSSHLHEAPEHEADPDETILIEDDEDNAVSSPTVPYTYSFESEETVLITRDEDDSLFIGANENEEPEADSPIPSSPTPETLIWDNIRQDMTIPINFDGHMAGAHGMPQAETTERLSIVADFAPFPMAGTEEDAVVGAEQEDPTDDGAWHASPVPTQDAGLAMGRKSLDATIDLNDFIDMAALAEPTQALEMPLPHTSYEGEDDSVTSDMFSHFPEETNGEADGEIEGVRLSDMDAGNVLANVQGDARFRSDDKAERPEHQITEDIAAETEEEQSVMGTTEEPEVPHYALPTMAFDARRKSLPAFGMQTPVKTGNRPYTSDGASMPRMVNAFSDPWWTRPRADSTVATPVRPSTAHGFASVRKTGTPAQQSATSRTPTTPRITPKERYPRREPRQDYQDHAQTAAAPNRFRTPVQTYVRRAATIQKPAASTMTPRASTLRPRPIMIESQSVEEAGATPAKTPSDRYPRNEPHQGPQCHANTVAAPTRFRTPAKADVKRPATTRKATETAVTPSASSLKPRAETVETPADPSTPVPTNSSPSEIATPSETPSERFPRLAPRADYVEHAKTVAGPARFRTPAQTPLKRPSTTQKPGSLRMAALKNSTPMASNTPVKTPLKPPAMTPSQAPMTPHPAAPLRGVTAMVEVFTLEGASASAPFVALLHRLGAKTTKVWSDRVTHVIFKDGSPTTLQRVRLHNKDIDESGKGSHIHCVNSRWVSDCEAEGTRVDEADEEYAVDVAEIPRGGKRRRKSMEPSALVNLGGNIVRDSKSSLGRSSLGRSPLKFDTPTKKHEMNVEITPKLDIEDKENSGDGLSSPATPAYLSAPNELVQQTAPINRMRKLGLKAQDRAKNRRLTYFPSRA
ncbi:hypothetical protein LTR85_002717 [Meristemomyces frigidus]|nr:hypothetical protein LTR85_002717 [Meristemomyces frigidus]